MTYNASFENKTISSVKKREKTRFKTPSSLIIGVFLLLSLIPLNSSRASYLPESFLGFETSEGYSTGALDSQQNWSSGSHCSSEPGACLITTDAKMTGENSLYFHCCSGYYYAEKTFKTAEKGYLSVWYWTPFGSFSEVLWLVFKNNETNLFSAYPRGYDGGFIQAIIEWNETQWRVITQATTTDWTDRDTKDLPVNKILFGGNGYTGGAIYIDEINYSAYVENEFYPVITPETPTDCERTTTTYDAVSVNGNINIPLESTSTWDFLIVMFEGGYPEATTRYLYLDLPDLKAGDSFYYSTTTTLPVALGYRVSYQFLGYDDNGRRTTPYYYCPETYISETPTIPPETITPYEEYPTTTEEICEDLGLVETWLCEIKNTLKGLFLPSQAKVGELRQNVELLKQKFPTNYLNLFSAFFTDLKNGVNSTSTIPFKILGQAGAVSFEFWETSSLVAGKNQKLNHIVKNFFTIAILFVFGFWAVSFLKRIFK